MGDLTAGNYAIMANYEGSDKYPKASDHSRFDVLRKATYFNFAFMNTTAVYTPHDGRVGEYFHFQLLDIDGKPLANKNVSIGFNGKIYNRTTNATGGAKLQINLLSANYAFALMFLGDENYSAAFDVSLIQVFSQKAKFTTASKTYKLNAKSKTLSVKMFTKSGNPIPNKQVIFKVNGKWYVGSTNEKGIATVKVSLNKKGTYSFTAKFDGDRMYSAATASGKITVK